MSGAASSGSASGWRRQLEAGSLAALGARWRTATTSRFWWGVAGSVLVLGGAAAGLHAPTSGAWFWHLADAELIVAHGLAGSALYLAHGGAALDRRSWLTDLAVLLIYRRGGLVGLSVGGAVLGALLGLALLLAVRRRPGVAPLAAVLAGGLGLAALAPVLNDLPTLVLALLGLALVWALELTRREGWGALAVVLVVVAWANLQADAAVAVLVVWGWVGVAHLEPEPAGGKRPSWWLLPLSLLALLLSPQFLGAITALPLSLGAAGEHPLLAAWSSISFHPWTARWAELAGLLLLLSYWLAGSRLRRADAYLGLLTAALALLWANYLPWFLVVAVVQTSWYLSVAWAEGTRPVPAMPGRGGVRGGRPLAALAILATLGTLGLAVHTVSRGGGPGGQAANQLPVAAARWLAARPQGGTWFTTPQFGDYLSARFPEGRHLVCTDDPLPLAGTPLQRCEQLTVLNRGALGLLDSLHPELAVLPRSAPAATFLLAEGWVIRYRDSTAVVLAPRSL